MTDIVVDGQSMISKRSSQFPPNEQYIGVAIPETHPFNYTGEVLALSPWSMTDPISLPLNERRELLRQRGSELLYGGSMANQYVDSVISADIDLTVC